jgi:tetratricopeptide (TPR) repeat protein
VPKEEITCLALDEVGMQLGLGTAQGMIRTYDLRTGRPTSATYRGHSGQVNALVFSPDGQRLFSASFDWSAKVWDTTSGLEVLALRGHIHERTPLGLSRDGQLLGLWGVDLRFKLWSAEDAPGVARAGDVAARLWDWHEQEARSSEEEGQWFAVAVHLTRLLEAAPLRDAWRYHQRRGDAWAWLERWSEAGSDFTQVVARQRKNVNGWRSRITAALAGGDLALYRELCQAMGKEFQKDESTLVASALFFTLIPIRESASPEYLLRLAGRIVKNSPNHARCVGAALYRAGRFTEALRLLQEVRPPRAWDLLFLAMTYHRLGQTRAAQQHLNEARTWMKQADEGGVPWAAWRERVEVETLRREAEALLSVNAGRPQ